MVRLGTIGVCGRGSASARAASEPTSHVAGTSGTAKIRVVNVRFVAGRRPNASGSTVGSRRTGNGMRRPRQPGDNDGVKRPKQQAKAGIIVPKMPRVIARGHAAEVILKISATVLAAINRFATPLARQRATAVINAAKLCGAFAIVNVSG